MNMLLKLMVSGKVVDTFVVLFLLQQGNSVS